jgi:hypothetical protein
MNMAAPAGPEPTCPIEAVFGTADYLRYPCTYGKGHDGPHSFESPDPPSVADLTATETF